MINVDSLLESGVGYSQGINSPINENIDMQSVSTTKINLFLFFHSLLKNFFANYRHRGKCTWLIKRVCMVTLLLETCMTKSRKKSEA